MLSSSFDEVYTERSECAQDKQSLRSKDLKRGFTLVELLVVVTIIGILSVVGISIFTGARQSGNDARKKADVAAITKAYEVNYNPSTGSYGTISGSWFASGQIPTPPEGGSYTVTPGGTGFQVCAPIGGTTPCNSPSATCYCKQSSQEQYISGLPTPTPGPTGTPTPGPGPDAFTKLLLHADGPNGSTIFSDSSAGSYTVTTGGNAQLNTTTIKFGSASGRFDGTGDYLLIPDSEDWNFGAGDFTVDTWLNMTAAPVVDWGISVFSQDSGLNVVSPIFLVITAARHVRLWASSACGGWDIFGGVDFGDATSILTLNTWHHFAFVRSGSSWRVFLDGTQFGSTQTSSATLCNSTNQVHLMGEGENRGGTGGLNGFMDEYRISKGVARWTTNFTPPTAPY